ncbi:pupal cuticle protein C1B-like [Diachasmimorpha longicaudata]|uniref:pupal cuticle protein C1B-like n=1 Tax=Diachasmimorpha longicaudata TaxID=58733 RepID=UPI0030B89BE8
MNKFFIVLTCLVAVARAGFAPLSYNLQEPSISSQSSNILRSPGNLQQISTYSKTVDTPFSSTSKSDVRVSNPGVYQTLSYAAPAHLHYAAPAPVVHAAPAQLHYAAPAPVLHAAPAPIHYAAPAAAVAAAPVHYAAPAAAVAAAPVHYAASAPVAAAPVVAHATFSGLGYSYAW